MPVINGKLVKELRCKNDNCRKLIAYEKIKEGIVMYVCPRCEFISEFRINYSKGQENIDILVERFEENEGR